MSYESSTLQSVSRSANPTRRSRQKFAADDDAEERTRRNPRGFSASNPFATARTIATRAHGQNARFLPRGWRAAGRGFTVCAKNSDDHKAATRTGEIANATVTSRRRGDTHTFVFSPVPRRRAPDSPYFVSPRGSPFIRGWRCSRLFNDAQKEREREREKRRDGILTGSVLQMRTEGPSPMRAIISARRASRCAASRRRVSPGRLFQQLVHQRQW